jgi:hypothetical protein
MAAKVPKDRTIELLEEVLEATQDLFILQALSAGVSGEGIRKLLHVDQWRVTNVSKLLKTRKKVEEK